MNLGKFRIRCSTAKGRILVEGRETFYDNFEHLVTRSPGMKSKEEFTRLQMSLERMPARAKILLERGLHMISGTNYPKPEFSLIMKLKYENGKWYAISPLSGEAFPVRKERGNPRKAFRGSGDVLDRIELFNEWSPVQMMEALESIFGNEAVGIMQLARKNVEEANRRAGMLLREICEKHKRDVMTGEFDGDKGFIVRGHLRNYFVNRVDGDVYAYPSGTHICIVSEEKEGVIADRVVSRIMLLLNDSKLKANVSTLDNVEEDEIEIELGG